jgi:hypothetical protein
MPTINRRDFFKIVAGVATTVGLAGCLASTVKEEDEEEKDSQEENHEHTHEDGQPHTH